MMKFSCFPKAPNDQLKQKQNNCNFAIRNRKHVPWAGVFLSSLSIISTSVLSRMPFSDWLRYSLDSEWRTLVGTKTAVSWSFRSACEDDLDKVLNDW